MWPLLNTFLGHIYYFQLLLATCSVNCHMGTEQFFTSDINLSVVTRTCFYTSTLGLILFQIIYYYDNNNLFSFDSPSGCRGQRTFYTKHVCEARDEKEDCKHSGSLENGYYLEWLGHEIRKFILFRMIVTWVSYNSEHINANNVLWSKFNDQ